MKSQIAESYEKLRSRYWFIPSVMAILAVALSCLLVALDLSNAEHRLIDLSWINLTGVAGTGTWRT